MFFKCALYNCGIVILVLILLIHQNKNEIHVTTSGIDSCVIPSEFT
jgi:hypothetical protein